MTQQHRRMMVVIVGMLWPAPLVAAEVLECRNTEPIDTNAMSFQQTAPPPVPEGMLPCTNPFRPQQALPMQIGEGVRYRMEINGITVGNVDFKIERRGRHEGLVVTEYRSHFVLDPLVSSLVSTMKGRAAALVPDGMDRPHTAMMRYQMGKDTFLDDFIWDSHGEVRSKRQKNGKLIEETRHFPEVVRDFITGFYLLRQLPKEGATCGIIYGNFRAYTLWLTYDGIENISTPIGKRPTDRYRVTYASEKNKKPYQARLWLSQDALRMPYRAELMDKQRIELLIHTLQMGKKK